MIYRVTKTLLKIHDNMEILRKNAGNCPTNHEKPGNDKGIQEVAFVGARRLGGHSLQIPTI